MYLFYYYLYVYLVKYLKNSILIFALVRKIFYVRPDDDVNSKGESGLRIFVFDAQRK